MFNELKWISSGSVDVNEYTVRKGREEEEEEGGGTASGGWRGMGTLNYIAGRIM